LPVVHVRPTVFLQHFFFLNADFRGVVTCLIDTQFLPEDPAISRGFVGP
jgi:hypothetical protein